MAIVAIVGRPNVGKSSLFNRIAGRRKAIVDDQPGITRDRLYVQAEWQGKSFYLVDTGGMTGAGKGNEEMATAIHRQVRAAINESDVLIFVTDTREGVTALDEEIAMELKKTGKPVIVAGNKIDDHSHEQRIYDLYRLGFKDVIGISSAHGRNIDELLDRLLEFLPEGEEEREEITETRLAIAGRPNVGKSTLLNRLANTERALVSDVPGTTRDTVDTVVFFGERPFRIVDTAGLRKRSKIGTGFEFYSLVRTQEAIDSSDITILLMQADTLCTDQDKKIAALVVEKGKGLILVVNKWDLLPKSQRMGDKVRDTVREEMAFVDFAPLLFMSAQSGRGIQKIPQLVAEIDENRKRILPPDLLRRIVTESFLFELLPADKKGKRLSISRCIQTGTAPPRFEFLVNDPTLVKIHFERHVNRIIRNSGDFKGVPIQIVWKMLGRRAR